MADFSAELETYLAADTGLNTHVGSGEHAKLFHFIARQGVSFPLVVIDESGGASSEILNGSTTIARGAYIIWSFGITPKEANDTWEAVRQALQTKNQVTFGSTYVLSVTMDPEWRDRGHYPPQDGSQRMIYYAASRFQIWHKVPEVV